MLSEVDVRHQALVSRYVRQEDEGEGTESIGHDAGAQQEKHNSLETSPLTQESDAVIVTAHRWRILLFAGRVLRRPAAVLRRHCVCFSNA